MSTAPCRPLPSSPRPAIPAPRWPSCCRHSSPPSGWGGLRPRLFMAPGAVGCPPAPPRPRGRDALRALPRLSQRGSGGRSSAQRSGTSAPGCVPRPRSESLSTRNLGLCSLLSDPSALLVTCLHLCCQQKGSARKVLCPGSFSYAWFVIL